MLPWKADELPMRYEQRKILPNVQDSMRNTREKLMKYFPEKTWLWHSGVAWQSVALAASRATFSQFSQSLCRTARAIVKLLPSLKIIFFLLRHPLRFSVRWVKIYFQRCLFSFVLIVLRCSCYTSQPFRFLHAIPRISISEIFSKFCESAK